MELLPLILKNRHSTIVDASREISEGPTERRRRPASAVDAEEKLRQESAPQI